MINRKIFLSVFVLGIAVTLAGTGTWAWMTDVQTSSDNTFTSGTLDLKLSNDGSTYTDDVTATWSSPNFKPGDTFANEIRFTNAGTIDINHLYMYPEALTNSGGTNNAKLSDKIYITKITGHITRDGANLQWGNRVGIITMLVGDHRSPLTLTEFCNARYVAYYTQPIVFGVIPPVLKEGDHKDWGLVFEGQFDPQANNDFQGASCSFNLRCVGSQNSPTEDYMQITDE